jgi:hypothetical protein
MGALPGRRPAAAPNSNGGWCRHQPPLSRGPVARLGEARRPPSSGSGKPPAPRRRLLPRLPDQDPKVLAVRRWPIPKDRPGNPNSSATVGPASRLAPPFRPCGDRDACASFTLGGGSSEPPFPRLRNRRPKTPAARVRIGWTRDRPLPSAPSSCRASAEAAALRAPGLSPSCRLSRRLRQPPSPCTVRPERLSAPAVAGKASVRFRPASLATQERCQRFRFGGRATCLWIMRITGMERSI